MDEQFICWWGRYNCDFDIYNFPKDSMKGAFIAGWDAGIAWAKWWTELERLSAEIELPLLECEPLENYKEAYSQGFTPQQTIVELTRPEPE